MGDALRVSSFPKNNISKPLVSGVGTPDASSNAVASTSDEYVEIPKLKYDGYIDKVRPKSFMKINFKNAKSIVGYVVSSKSHIGESGEIKTEEITLNVNGKNEVIKISDVDTIQVIKTGFDVQKDEIKNRFGLSYSDYHDKISNEQNPFFKFKRGGVKGPKPLIVLCTGRGQSFSDDPKQTGVLKIYNDLAEREDVDVLLLRVGGELLGGDSILANLHANNVLEDIFKQRGIFKDVDRPTQFLGVGYSWGAGSLHSMLSDNKIQRNVPINTVFIDGFKLGEDVPLNVRPFHGGRHLHLYQSGGVLAGAPLRKVSTNDQVICIPKSNHSSIDDNESVQSNVLNFIRECLKKPVEKSFTIAA